MPDRRFLKPARPGLVVRDPDRGGQRMADDGAWVHFSPFWHRRMADGDVVEASPPAEAPPVTAAPPATSSGKSKKD